MSTMLYSLPHRGEVTPDDGDVRSTTNVIDNDASSAVAETRPDFNANESDPDTEGGLTPREVSDYVTPGQRYVPNVGNANTDFAAPINSQVSTAGRAPAEEMAGRWGHGAMQWSDATEPTIREGGAFDDVYFSANRPPIQDGTMDYMIPARRPDTADAESISRGSKAESRAAARRSMYQTFLDNSIG